jgi:rod shape-determining protein MreD
MRRQAPPWRLMNAAERRRYWWGHWRLGVPGGVTLFLLLLTTAPILVPVPVFPLLAPLAIFVWATFQPALMPPWLAFGLGVTADLLFGQPIGVNATLFAATAGFVRLFEARYGHRGPKADWRFDWAMAAGVIIAFELATWQLMALAGQPVPLLPLGWQVLTSIVAYPIVAQICAWAQRRAFDEPLVP